jgi:hypothetical protein
MSNSHLGKIDVRVDDKIWSLKFSINALCALEGELGSGQAVDIQRLIGESPSVSTLRTLFWAALQEHHAGVSKEDAGRLMNALGLLRSTEIVTQVLLAAFGDMAKMQGDTGPLAGTGAARPLAATG